MEERRFSAASAVHKLKRASAQGAATGPKGQRAERLDAALKGRSSTQSLLGTAVLAHYLLPFSRSFILMENERE